ncbi:MAG: ABC transporter ATP-binding protein [Candidatus Berkiella sp.]
MLLAKNIFKTYANSAAPILNGLNLSLDPGDFCVVIGSNGSGKSTLLKALSGECAIDKGQIFMNGQEITARSYQERAKLISSVSQNTAQGTIGQMTLMENLILSQLRGQKAKYSLINRKDPALRQTVLDLNPLLEPFLDKPLDNLSGGQKQIVATIMATLNRPHLLLLDEHCSALDPKAQKIVMDFTSKTIKKNQITALMVTHDLADALHYGNRLMMLHHGNIILDVNKEQKDALSISQLLLLFQTSQEEAA